jgi:hypothetical protein
VLLVVGGGTARGRTAIVNGVVEGFGPRIRWGLRHLTLVDGGATAITFGHVVLGRDAETLDRTRGHERVHVRQYERWGPLFFLAYLGASVWVWTRGGDAYRDNPFEREARRVEAALPVQTLRGSAWDR